MCGLAVTSAFVQFCVASCRCTVSTLVTAHMPHARSSAQRSALGKTENFPAANMHARRRRFKPLRGGALPSSQFQSQSSACPHRPREDSARGRFGASKHLHTASLQCPGAFRTWGSCRSWSRPRRRRVGCEISSLRAPGSGSGSGAPQGLACGARHVACSVCHSPPSQSAIGCARRSDPADAGRRRCHGGRSNGLRQDWRLRSASCTARIRDSAAAALGGGVWRRRRRRGCCRRCRRSASCRPCCAVRRGPILLAGGGPHRADRAESQRAHLGRRPWYRR